LREEADKLIKKVNERKYIANYKLKKYNQFKQVRNSDFYKKLNIKIIDFFVKVT